MLADFPNPNGWALVEEDVFGTPEQSPQFHAALQAARVVLCNPPFEPFKPRDRALYELRSVHKPVELLQRVLDQLGNQGLLGFVLPQQLLNGVSYRSIRERLAERYEEIELVGLPDKVFEKSEHETALLLAKVPRTHRGPLSILHRKVEDRGWPLFNAYSQVSREDAGAKTPAQASDNIGIPDLQSIWTRTGRITHGRRCYGRERPPRHRMESSTGREQVSC